MNGCMRLCYGLTCAAAPKMMQRTIKIPNPMKKLSFSILIIMILALVRVQAEDYSALPFPVSVGGNAAAYKAGEPFAKIDKAVKSDAAIEVDSKAAMIIINVTKADDKGQPESGATPAVILLQNTNKGTLAGTMDKKALAAGHYLMSVVADGKTASVLITVE